VSTYHRTLLVTTLAVLVSISVYLRRYPMRYFGTEYPMWQVAFETANDASTPAADVLIVGDSRTKAGLLPEAFGPNSYSLTLGGAEPATLYHLLATYLRTHRAPRVVILSIAPYHFSKAEAFWERGQKFGLMSWDDTQAILSRALELGDPLLGNGVLELHGQALLYAARAPHLYFAELWNARGGMRGPSNDKVRASIRERRGQQFFGTAKSHSGKCWETQLEHLGVSPLLDDYVRRMLELSLKSGAQTHFLTMPMNTSSARALKPAYRAELAEHLEKLARAHPRADVDTALPELADSYFGDESHLNESGARFFSERLAARVGAPTAP
jgi:hypothetical protein